MIRSESLLSEFSDSDNDALSIINLSSSVGQIKSNGNNTWLLSPSPDFFGDILLSYDVTDHLDGFISVERSISIQSVNDPPRGRDTTI